MELTRLPPAALIALAIAAGLTCQLLLGTSYVAASLDPLAQQEGVPVAIVILDAGPHGDAMLKRLQASVSPILWVEVADREDLVSGLQEKRYFGAIVVPENFSANLDSFASQTPRAAYLDTWTNPGASTSGSLIAAGGIARALDALRDAVRGEALRGADLATTGLGGLTIQQGRWLAEPVQTHANAANPVPPRGANGLAPTYLAMAAWIGGYLGAIALERFRPQTRLRALPRAAFLAGAALLQGALATGTAMAIGLSVPDALGLALALSLGTWMAYAVVSLLADAIGIAAVLPAFALLALGLPAAGAIYPTGLLPDLYRALYAVNPFTWLIEMLRTTLYAPGAGDLAHYGLRLGGLALACTGLSALIDLLRARRASPPENANAQDQAA